MKRIPFLLTILLYSIFQHGMSHANSYSKSVLETYFDVSVPNKIIQNHQFRNLQKTLKSRSTQNYTDFGLHSGIFTVKIGKLSKDILWVYSNKDIHSGNFVLLNDALEVIYLNTNMGLLHIIEIKDLLENEEQILMITHGAGGTGVYTLITDLITFNETKNNSVLPEFRGSILKKAHDANLPTFGRLLDASFSDDDLDKFSESNPSIECEAKTSLTTGDDGKKSLAIDVSTTVNLDETNLNSALIEKLKNSLKKHNLLLNEPTTVRSTLIEDLKIPQILLFHSALPNKAIRWPLV